jgi:biopolymer transport protein ExbB/TolQ
MVLMIVMMTTMMTMVMMTTMLMMMMMMMIMMIGNRQLAEAHRFAQEMESTNEESDRRTQSTIAQLKEKYMSAMTPLEARLRMETDTVKMLHAKIRYDDDGNGIDDDDDDDDDDCDR